MEVVPESEAAVHRLGAGARLNATAPRALHGPAAPLTPRSAEPGHRRLAPFAPRLPHPTRHVCRDAASYQSTAYVNLT